jgi:Tfp pilus tip-associated adhesin PilY1
MGAAQSSTSVPVQSGPKDPSFDGTTSGLRVTTSAGELLSAASPPTQLSGDSEEKLKQAYAKGKEDGLAAIQGALEAVAAQTYDQMYNQLKELQTESVEKSKKLVSTIVSQINLHNIFLMMR